MSFLRWCDNTYLWLLVNYPDTRNCSYGCMPYKIIDACSTCPSCPLFDINIREVHLVLSCCQAWGIWCDSTYVNLMWITSVTLIHCFDPCMLLVGLWLMYIVLIASTHCSICWFLFLLILSLAYCLAYILTTNTYMFIQSLYLMLSCLPTINDSHFFSIHEPSLTFCLEIDELTWLVWMEKIFKAGFC